MCERARERERETERECEREESTYGLCMKVNLPFLDKIFGTHSLSLIHCAGVGFSLKNVTSPCSAGFKGRHCVVYPSHFCSFSLLVFVCAVSGFSHCC